MADPTTESRNVDDELLQGAIPIDSEDDDRADDASPEEAGEDEDELQPIDLASAPADAGQGASKIKALGQRKPHDEHWQRKPNVTGQGAIHCKTFVAKLRYDAIEHLDEQVNHWLDAHPEYEVKFVTTTVGTLRGKLMEEALFMNVWV